MIELHDLTKLYGDLRAVDGLSFTVARGEVVVVDGNYGVRVKQIISRKERLRTLH